MESLDERSISNGEQGILFAMEGEMKRVPDVKAHHLFDSGIYPICRKDAPLSEKALITAEDLKGRTLMVGGGSQAPLRAVQQRVISRIHCGYFNSRDHDTSLTNVAAGRAIVLAPGFLNDHTGEFVRIPFDCPEKIPCALYTHKTDSRRSVIQFIKIIRKCIRNTLRQLFNIRRQSAGGLILPLYRNISSIEYYGI